MPSPRSALLLTPESPTHPGQAPRRHQELCCPSQPPHSPLAVGPSCTHPRTLSHRSVVPDDTCVDFLLIS